MKKDKELQKNHHDMWIIGIINFMVNIVKWKENSTYNNLET